MAILRRYARDVAPLIDLNAPDAENSFQWFSMADPQKSPNRLVDFMKRYRTLGPAQKMRRKTKQKTADRDQIVTRKKKNISAADVSSSRGSIQRRVARVSPRARMFRIEAESRSAQSTKDGGTFFPSTGTIPRWSPPPTGLEDTQPRRKNSAPAKRAIILEGKGEDATRESKSFSTNVPPGNLEYSTTAPTAPRSTRESNSTISDPPGVHTRMSADSHDMQYDTDMASMSISPSQNLRESMFSAKRFEGRGPSILTEPHTSSSGHAGDTLGSPPGNFAAPRAFANASATSSLESDPPGMMHESPPGNFGTDPPGVLRNMSATTRGYISAMHGSEGYATKTDSASFDDESSTPATPPSDLRASFFSPKSFADFLATS